MALPFSQSGGGGSSLSFTPENVANKDVASGYAGLDSDTLLKQAEFPNVFSMLYPYLKNLSLALAVEAVTVAAGDGGAINFTVPNGKRAFVDLMALNASGATDTVQLEFQPGGSGPWYSVLAALAGLTAGNGPSILSQAMRTVGTNIIFEPGDVIAVKGTNGTALVYGGIYTFDSSSPLRTPRFLGTLPIGDNTIYTVSAGKNMIPYIGYLDSAPVMRVGPQPGLGVGVIVKEWYRKPSGVSLDSNRHKLIAPVAAALTANSNSAINFGALTAGDSIVFSLHGTSAFTLTSVANASGGSTVYTGTITGGTTNAFAGQDFYIVGFGTAANNGKFTCSASTTTTLTLNNTSGVAETHTAQAIATKFTISSVANASGGSTVYTGVFTNGGSNNFANWKFTIAGLGNSANNGSFTCSASTTTTITVNNPNGVAETHAGTAAFESIPAEIFIEHVLEF